MAVDIRPTCQSQAQELGTKSPAAVSSSGARSNRMFVTVECLYGYKQAIADGIKRIVKP